MTTRRLLPYILTILAFAVLYGLTMILITSFEKELKNIIMPFLIKNEKNIPNIPIFFSLATYGK